MRRGVGWLTSVLMVLVTAGCGGGDATGTASTPTGSPSPVETASPTADPATEGSSSSAGSAGEDDADVAAEVTVEGGQVTGGVERVPVEIGQSVALRVASDVADTVHVHGYDLHASVGPDEAAVVRFGADIPGVFEVELEQRGLLIAELEVTG